MAWPRPLMIAQEAMGIPPRKVSPTPALTRACAACARSRKPESRWSKARVPFTTPARLPFLRSRCSSGSTCPSLPASGPMVTLAWCRGCERCRCATEVDHWRLSLFRILNSNEAATSVVWFSSRGQRTLCADRKPTRLGALLRLNHRQHNLCCKAAESVEQRRVLATYARSLRPTRVKGIILGQTKTAFPSLL